MTEDDLVEEIFERFCLWARSLGYRTAEQISHGLWSLRQHREIFGDVDLGECRVYFVAKCVVCLQDVERVQRRRSTTTPRSKDMFFMTHTDVYRRADFHATSCLLEWWSRMTDADLPGPGERSVRETRDPSREGRFDEPGGRS